MRDAVREEGRERRKKRNKEYELFLVEEKFGPQTHACLSRIWAPGPFTLLSKMHMLCQYFSLAEVGASKYVPKTKTKSNPLPGSHCSLQKVTSKARCIHYRQVGPKRSCSSSSSP